MRQNIDFCFTRAIKEVVIKQKKSFGNDLLSQGVAPQVPSALTSLTTGFEMLPGVPTSLRSPKDFLFSSFSANTVCMPSFIALFQKSTEFPTPHEEALDH